VSGWRTARRSAWAKLGWRHPLLVLFGPVLLAALAGVAGWAFLSYLWATVPHAWLAAVAAVGAVAVAGKLAFRRPASGLVTVLGGVAVLLLLWAALAAARG
jgi:hypothetical protein